jgi:hypothetical protein
MRHRDSPEHEPPAPDQTLVQWLSDTSADWLVSQPTLWLPAVRPDPVGRTGPPERPDAYRPAIPRQRARASAHRRAGRRPVTPAGPAPVTPAGPGPEPADEVTAGRSRPVVIALSVAVLLLFAAALLIL